MKLSNRSVGGVPVVDVEGDVDMYSSPGLREQLSKCTAKKPRRIVVNLAAVEFMDSSGIATLVQAYKEARPFNGQVCLASPAGNVLRVLKLSNLTSLFPVFDTVEDAVKS
jgi:anti-sigma B factor antagonist